MYGNSSDSFFTRIIGASAGVKMGLDVDERA
jgi:hypothetical protein